MDKSKSVIKVRDAYGKYDAIKALKDKFKAQRKVKQTNTDESILTSRSFALTLIVIASLYIIVMICQAQKGNMNLDHSRGSVDYTYEYETESYDFEKY